MFVGYRFESSSPLVRPSIQNAGVAQRQSKRLENDQQIKWRTSTERKGPNSKSLRLEIADATSRAVLDRAARHFFQDTFIAGFVTT